MKKEPVVTVVVPVFNGEQYIKSCLDNMMLQTYKKLDIIVVDDGSVDKSADIVREYPVRLIQHEKNRGLSAARNTGIDAAKGEYIHFMDADDSINADYYKEMVAAITETDADMACGGMINEKKRYKTQLFKKRKVYTKTQDKLKVTYVGKWGYVWRYLFKFDFLKQNNLRFEEGRLIEDLTFSIPAVYYANKLVTVPHTAYSYYHRENSIMTCKDAKHRIKRRKDWEHARDFRDEFSKEKGIKLPGVHTGKMAYIVRKLIKLMRL
ncbi:MAG: glycosyltransferase [Dysgonamonadaceae bacterium]|nr:glycosyltransferase [Dysgonamonadaceae bacterium]